MPCLSRLGCASSLLEKKCSVPDFVKGHGLVVKHLIADPGIASSIPAHTNKNTKRRYLLVLARQKALVFQFYDMNSLGTLTSLDLHVCLSLYSLYSTLPYGQLIETSSNNLHAPTPSGNFRLRRKINVPRLPAPTTSVTGYNQSVTGCGSQRRHVVVT